MAPEVRLDRVQRWMQSVVVHPGSVEEAVVSPEACAQVAAERVGGVIRPSKTLTSVERVGIYHGMYLLRMEEALASDYPALQHFLGERNFRTLVAGYVQAFPSRSYTLNRLGDHLPEYVKAAPGLPRQEFCHDLARLELLVTQVFDGPQTQSLSAKAIAAVPEEAWERARLTPVAAFRLGAFRYPVNAYLESTKGDDHAHPKPRRKDTWVAVFRRDYRTRRLDLTRPAHELLSDLASSTPLGEALTAAQRRNGKRGPGPEELFRWFRDWISAGMFSRVELA
jgi:Putative DNA-binding domain